MLGSCVFGNVALVIDRFDISSSCRKLNLDTVWIRFMIYLAGANMRAENVQQNSQTAEQWSSLNTHSGTESNRVLLGDISPNVYLYWLFACEHRNIA